MKESKTRTIVFIALYVSLSIVLDYIKEFIPFLNMPSGGSINIALIPIVLVSFYLGVKKGIIAGLIWWLLSFIIGLNKWFISIPQYLLDYIIPSGIIGISSLFYKKKNNYEIIIGIILMMFIRTLCLVISGAYYWPGELASGSKAAFIYSLSYNLPYSILTTIMLIIVVPLIIRNLKHK